MLACGNLARSRLQVLKHTYPSTSCLYTSLAHCSKSDQPSISLTAPGQTIYPVTFFSGMGSGGQRRQLSNDVDGNLAHTGDLIPSGM